METITDIKFSLVDVEKFARLSGDWNPIHLDPVAARRLLFGGPVVHGIFVMLWALDMWLKKRDSQKIVLRNLKVDFKNPMKINGAPSIVTISEEEFKSKIRVETDEQVICNISVSFKMASAKKGLISEAEYSKSNSTEHIEHVLEGASGEVPLQLAPALSSELFPVLTERLPGWQLAAILCTTQIVGMKCPGQHSIYSSMESEFGEESEETVKWNCTEYDSRLKRCVLKLAASGFHSKIVAFVRPGPTLQKKLSELDVAIHVGSLKNINALIVGGSRGLGEVAAKMLAKGGAEVTITYRCGVEDAELVVSDIRNSGYMAHCMTLDATAPLSSISRLFKDRSFTHLLYFATPAIRAEKAGTISQERLNEYMAIYVSGFCKVVEALAVNGPLRSVMYPSSIYVNEMPAGFGAYSVAKAAGEVAARFLSKNRKGLSVYIERFSRLATDQNSGLMGNNGADPKMELEKAVIRMMKEEINANKGK